MVAVLCSLCSLCAREQCKRWLLSRVRNSRHVKRQKRWTAFWCYRYVVCWCCADYVQYSTRLSPSLNEETGFPLCFCFSSKAQGRGKHGNAEVICTRKLKKKKRLSFFVCFVSFGTIMHARRAIRHLIFLGRNPPFAAVGVSDFLPSSLDHRSQFGSFRQ